MYTQGTQNFNLPLYQGTDKPAWTDTNEGYAAIDEAVGGAVASVEGLDTRVSTVEAEISDPTTGLDAQLASVKEDVTTLSGDVGALSGTVSGLQSEIDDVRADSEDMITSNHEATATSSKRYEVGQYFIYNDVLYKCTVQINQGDTIVPNTNCEATNVMTEMPSGGGTHKTIIASQTGTGTQTAAIDISTKDSISCVVKKSGTIVSSVDIPTAVIALNDVILLGTVAPVIGVNNIPSDKTVDSGLVGKEISNYRFNAGSPSIDITCMFGKDGTSQTSGYAIGLGVDNSSLSGAAVTYSATNTFTLSVVDNDLSLIVLA